MTFPDPTRIYPVHWDPDNDCPSYHSRTPKPPGSPDVHTAADNYNNIHVDTVTSVPNDLRSFSSLSLKKIKMESRYLI